jgi:hypothetical protein
MSLIWFLSILFIVLLFVVLAIMKWRKVKDADYCTPRIFQFNGDFSNFDDSDEPRYPFDEVAKNYSIQQVKKFSDANLILFSDYTLYDQNFDKLPYKERCNYKIFAVNGIDMLANKKTLAEKLKGTGLTPSSYPLDDEKAKQELLKDHYPGKLYIVKANRQRQTGNLITKDVDFIVNKAWKEQYVVAQELLQNPFLVNGRKINMRFYVLIIIKGNLCDWYIYNDGFIYYAPEFFEKGSTEDSVNITTGLKDRSIYKDNPLTHQDLYKFMGPEKAATLQKNVQECFRRVHEIYRNELVKKNKGSPGLQFCLYGADIAPDENLNVQIMELNKGPSLDKKDDRDGALKYGMVRDAFAVVDIISGEPKNFIEV